MPRRFRPRKQWWDAAMIAIIVAIALTGSGSTGGLVPLALGILVVAWFAMGRWAVEPSAVRYRWLWGAGFVIVLTAALMVLCSRQPIAAILLFVACPYAWNWTNRLWAIILANAAVAAGVGAGDAWYAGWTRSGVVNGAKAAAVYLLFSLAMGAWIRHIENFGRERGRLQAQLDAVNDEVVEMQRRAGAAAERERLAHEIHDTLTQTLTGVVMMAEEAGRQLTADPLHPDAARTIALVEHSARQALAETRAIIAEGQAPGVGPAGLPDRLDRLMHEFAEQTGLSAQFSCRPTRPVLERPDEVILLRAAQEALANIRKHANARCVEMSLEQDAGNTTLTVHDDGRGFPTDVDVATSSGYGLRGIQSRLALADGCFDLNTGTAGTELRIILPRDGDAHFVAVSEDRAAGARDGTVDAKSIA
ncbi:sensor histidine kinase [Propionibacterium sp.]|uniref:sensor histidine kinase n=1 Tax=Propionibacterium sp. TaxID=1977903 RepID=UPI0039E95E2F